MNLFKKIVGTIAACSYGLAVYAVLRANIMPTKYLLVLIPITAVLVVLLVRALFKEKQRGVLTTMLLVALSFLVVSASALTYNASKTATALLQGAQNVSKTSTNTNIKKPYTIYISGIDSYGEVDTVSRSDVNILAVVNPKDNKVLLVNTPRDYYVQLHGTTGVRDKLTHAGIYGIDMSKNTLQDLYGTKVDYTVRINFSSLLKLVDAAGGINVYSDYTFKAGGYSFVQGYNTLDSKQALVFARERYAFADGDRQRGKHQQRVIEALITKLSQPRVLLGYQGLLNSLNGTFRTNASQSEITSIIKQQLGSIGAWKTESISVDGTGSSNVTYSINQPLYVMIPDQATVDAAKAKIQQYLR